MVILIYLLLDTFDWHNLNWFISNRSRIRASRRRQWRTPFAPLVAGPIPLAPKHFSVSLPPQPR
jgi:hypothetical protein